MRVTVQFFAQLGAAAGAPSATVDVDEPCTAQELLGRLAAERGDAFREMVFDGAGALRPSILLFVGDTQVRWSVPRPLADRDTLMLATPIAGG